MEWTIRFGVPVVVGFDLAAFLLCGEHDDYADVFLPDDVPEVLLHGQLMSTR